MKKYILFFVTVSLLYKANAQNFTGQWKGEYIDKSPTFIGIDGNKGEYWLDIECNGTTVTGISHTYFKDDVLKYTNICRIEGFIDTVKHYMEIKEVELIKTTVPEEVRNCFGIHRLNYIVRGQAESLEGNWIPVPTQRGKSQIKGCGYGTTSLVKTKVKGVAPIAVPVIIDTLITKTSKPIPIDTATAKIPVPDYKKRSNNILKIIEIEGDSIKVDLYDNGDVDGDDISLFYNGKLLFLRKTLSDKAISLKLKVDYTKTNELVMYAQNLGKIPPNSALMVITDGSHRYEVFVTSDMEKSGVLRFIHKPGNVK